MASTQLQSNQTKEGRPAAAAALPLLLLFVFIDILGFSIILPLLPHYADLFGASPSIMGCIMASNAMAQFVGAPIIGRLSDIYGRRPLLLACIFSTFVSFVMLAMAQSLAVVFTSRIIDGLLGGNIALAQAYISGWLVGHKPLLFDFCVQICVIESNANTYILLSDYYLFYLWLIYDHGGKKM